MTNADIFCRILAETTGRPERTFRSILAALPPAHRGKLDATCHDAPALLEQLRAEKSGILNWLVQGAAMAHRAGQRQQG